MKPEGGEEEGRETGAPHSRGSIKPGLSHLIPAGQAASPSAAFAPHLWL